MFSTFKCYKNHITVDQCIPDLHFEDIICYHITVTWIVLAENTDSAVTCASLETFWQNETRNLVTRQRIQEALPTLSFSPPN